jgi:membrane protein insertase Oxa1/YidC/SpoIIIJ
MAEVHLGHKLMGPKEEEEEEEEEEQQQQQQQQQLWCMPIALTALSLF